MNSENPLLEHSPEDFYDELALEAAKAIRNSELDKLKALLMQSPEIANNRGRKDLPLLAWAMGHRSVDAFRLLLDSGATPNDFFLVNDQPMSLLSLAAATEQEDYFDLLLSSKADPNGLPGTEPPLFTAFFADLEERFFRLLDAGANINLATATGATIILTAAIAGDYKLAIRLAEKGADLNAEMTNGTNLRSIIDKFPLAPDTEQGRAQLKIRSLLRQG